MGTLRVGPSIIWAIECTSHVPKRIMEGMLDTLRDECCIPYLNNVLCFSRSFDEHVQVLRRVLQALQHHGVKLKPEKCKLFRKEVRDVGQLVSAKGVKIRDRRIISADNRLYFKSDGR